VVIARLPAEDLLPYLPSLVEGLLIWAEDSKNHFKMKVSLYSLYQAASRFS
jgi:ribosomal RNA-processing protein 12